MDRFLRLIRASDWWHYHLLPLLGVSYTAIAVFAVPAGMALPALLRLALSIAFVAAFSHAVNDLGDTEADARAGKPNRLAALPGWQREALCLVLLAGGVAAWAGAGLSAQTSAILASIVVLQPAYALRPVRLKERGAWGLIADALHTHALPTLFCCVLFADLAGASPWRPFPLAAAAWSFCVGLRGILYHQRVDEANDRRAGSATFVTMRGSAAAGALARRAVFPAELAALAALGASLWPVAPEVVVAFAAYGSLLQGLRGVGIWRVSLADPAPADRAAYYPLLAFYRSWPAPAFALLLAVRQPGYTTLLATHCALFPGPILRQAVDLRRLLIATAGAVSRRVQRKARRASS